MLKHKHYRRDPAVATQVDYVTVEPTEVVVYVDEKGDPVSTTTIYGTTTPTPTPFTTTSSESSSSSSSSQPIANAYYAQPPPVQKAATPGKSVKGSDSSSQKPPPSSGGGSGGLNIGSAVTYSPYLSNNNCKDPAAVKQDFATLLETPYEVVRLYGTDCNQTATVLDAISSTNVKIMAGVFHVDQVQSEIQAIADAVKMFGGSWDKIVAVGIGNEPTAVNPATGQPSYAVSQVVGAVTAAKSQLTGAGAGSVPIGAVDTMMNMTSTDGIAMCQVAAADFCGINTHPFFNGQVLPEDSGPWISNWMKKLGSSVPGKTIITTETGWPWGGQSNNQAVPSLQNQQKAVASITGTLKANVFLFSAFNTKWKDPGAFGAEQMWGLGKKDAPSG